MFVPGPQDEAGAETTGSQQGLEEEGGGGGALDRNLRPLEQAVGVALYAAQR